LLADNGGKKKITADAREWAGTAETREGRVGISVGVRPSWIPRQGANSHFLTLEKVDDLLKCDKEEKELKERPGF